MTRQETFDIVATHLLKQGKRAEAYFDGTKTCAYRGNDGSKCAAGILIEDGDYNHEWEGDSLHSSNECDYRDENSLEHYLHKKGHDIKLVCKLQEIHDNEPPNYWSIHLADLAAEEGLEFRAS